MAWSALDGSRSGDLWAYNGFAYVGSYGAGANCPAKGVRIVDLADPTSPQQIGAVAAIPGTSAEDVEVRHIVTTAFNGDLLVAGIQRCDRSGAAGLALYDVSDPRAPVQLGFFATGAARGVHELDLIQQDDRVLALLAVPFSERDAPGTGDFRIVDVSDPRHPAQLSQWGAKRDLGIDITGGIGCQRMIFDHSARASADGRRVYLSYWDAGVFILDINDPSTPHLAGRIQYPSTEEGETHSVTESVDGRTLFVADEDFGASVRLRVDGGGEPLTMRGCEARFGQSLNSSGQITSVVVAVGTGCPDAALRTDPTGKVAFVDAGGCTDDAKAQRLLEAGAQAVLLPASGDPVSLPGGRRLNVPVVSIGERDASALRAALGQGPARIVLPTQRVWGGLRAWDISNLAAPRQIGNYQTPEGLQFPPPSPGDFTVHNPEVVGHLAFVSAYSSGVRVLDVSDPSNPVEVASLVPGNGTAAGGTGNAFVWGVAISGDLVLLSDLDNGLYVLRWSATP